MSKDAIGKAGGQTVEGIFGPMEGAVATPAGPAAVAGSGIPRVQRPDRSQMVTVFECLDRRLPREHQARIVWEFAASADLSALYESIKAVEGRAGRSPIDPRILLSLHLFAILDGVGSAREMARLCEEHDAYRWLCGGVSVNYHTISDFRVGHAGVLDQLLTDGVAALMHEGLVTMDRVAQDGMRVRANAGAASFRRKATLEELQTEACEQMQTLREELDGDASAASKRQQAARERAARERAERVRQALEGVKELESKRQKQAGEESSEPRAASADAKNPDGAKAAKSEGEEERKDDENSLGGGQQAALQSAEDDADAKGVAVAAGKTDDQGKKKQPGEPRASTTDPEARVMKMADGGFRPAFNAEIATDTGSGIITGVEVSTSGSDQGQMVPMIEQHQERYGQRPGAMLVDGGFAKKEDIEQASLPGMGVTVYAPVQKPKKEGQDRYARRAGDSDAIAEWRARMGSEQGKAIYKERASTAEWTNAMARNRGLYQFLVRGLEKVKAVLLLFALAHNLMRGAALRAQAALAMV